MKDDITALRLRAIGDRIQNLGVKVDNLRVERRGILITLRESTDLLNTMYSFLSELDVDGVDDIAIRCRTQALANEVILTQHGF